MNMHQLPPATGEVDIGSMDSAAVEHELRKRVWAHFVMQGRSSGGLY